MKKCYCCFEDYDDSYQSCPNCGFVPGSPPEELSHLYPGTVLLDRYIVGKAVGFGGFGITYKAWDKKLDIIVAVKEYFPSGVVTRTPGTKEVIVYAKRRQLEYDYGKTRFLDEARNMAKFNSEANIINVFEYFEENNTAYIAMEFLNGISLSSFMHANNELMDVDQCIDIANSIGNALCKIHSKGIIHRDVSPDNIFLCVGGGIKLIDFGAARFSQDEGKLMTIILKPGFAPPEQYEKVNEQGPWTDVYALGATLYYALTGIKPEESTNRKIKDEVVYPHMLNPQIPENLSNCIMKAMSIDLRLRFSTVEEFLNAIGANKPIVPIEVERRKKKNKRIIGICAAAIVLIIGACIGLLSFEKKKSEATLPDTSIEMWYCKSGTKELDEAEEAAYKDIIKDFNSTYPNVTITLKGFDKNEYESALKSGKPAIYEYEGTFASSTKLDLGQVYDSQIAQKCSQLKKAKDCFGGQQLLPLGYEVPVVYENTNLSDETSAVTSLDELKQKGSVASDSKLYDDMFSGADTLYSENAQKDFCDGKLSFYASTSTNRKIISASLPAQYRLLRCDAQKIECKYECVWAASDNDTDQNKVSLRFLEFMLNNSSQDSLHIKNHSQSIPINDEVKDVFVKVFDDFEGIFENTDKYQFTK